MAISFPSSPATGTSYYSGGRQWTYDGTSWNLAISGSYELYWTHTATGGETTISGASDNSTTLSYSLGQENVYQNGVLLVRGSDYTATTGSSITLSNALSAGDILTIVTYPAIQLGSSNIASTTEPSTYTPGMVWVNTSGNVQGLQTITWIKSPTAGTTILTGLADNGTTTLAYTVGQELLHLNGVLLVRGTDYTATNGTSITLTQATVAGDIVELIGTNTIGVTNTYTQSQSDARYLQPAGYGNDGLVPVSSYNATGGYVWEAPIYAGKNIVTNGAMDIWQRGTSFPNATGWVTDRWYQVSSNITTTQETTIVPTGFQYSMKGTVTSGTSAPQWGQTIEFSNFYRFLGKTVTLSAYIATSDSSSAYLRIDYGTSLDAGITGSYTILASSTPSATSSMPGSPQYLTATIPTNAKSLRIYVGNSIQQSSGATTTVTGVQLEVGSVATSFSRTGGSIQDELEACQRYYWQVGGDATNQTLDVGIAYSTSACEFVVQYPIFMRIVPTPSFSSLMIQQYTGGTTYPVTAVSNLNGNSGGRLAMGVGTTIGTTSLTVGSTYLLKTNSTLSGYLAFSAEL
jgi:hypothetical protein